MLTVANWWPWCSKAAVISALRVGYQVHVIVSDCQNDPPAEPFLDDLKTRFPGRVNYSRDSRPRETPTDHACTRYDYLPEILEHYRVPVLVTDADVIHRRALRLPDGFDVGYGYWSPWPLERVAQSSRAHRQPLVWIELGTWLMAGAVVVAPTEAGIAFARRCQQFIEDLRSFGLAGAFPADQLAVYGATRRLDPDRTFRLNRERCEDVCSTPSHTDHAVWLPHPQLDTKGEWKRAAAAIAAGPADGRIGF